MWDYQGIGLRVAHPMRKKGMQLATVQGYLAHKKQCPPRPLQQDYAYGCRVLEFQVGLGEEIGCGVIRS